MLTTKPVSQLPDDQHKQKVSDMNKGHTVSRDAVDIPRQCTSSTAMQAIHQPALYSATSSAQCNFLMLNL